MFSYVATSQKVASLFVTSLSLTTAASAELSYKLVSYDEPGLLSFSEECRLQISRKAKLLFNKTKRSFMRHLATILAASSNVQKPKQQRDIARRLSRLLANTYEFFFRKFDGSFTERLTDILHAYAIGAIARKYDFAIAATIDAALEQA
ncbi:MAG: hypothetical protein PVJ92_01030 [Candidatus Dependentiae bacterium]|jgi:hypothetical protein